MNQVITNIPVGPKWNKMPNHNFGLHDNDQIQIHSFFIIFGPMPKGILNKFNAYSLCCLEKIFIFLNIKMNLLSQFHFSNFCIFSFTTIFVQNWSVTIFSRMFTF